MPEYRGWAGRPANSKTWRENAGYGLFPKDRHPDPYCVLLRRKLRRGLAKFSEAPDFSPPLRLVRCAYRCERRCAAGLASNGKARSMRNFFRKRFRKSLWRFTRVKKRRSAYTRAGIGSGMLGASA